MKKSEFWNIQPILGKRCDINLCIGQRGNGKTYGVLKFFLQEYKRTKKRFCYVRRWKDDIPQYNMELLFTPFANDIAQIFGEGYSIGYNNRKFYLINDAEEKIDIIGYVLSLSASHHYKSVAFINVGFILFDEFIPTQGEKKLANEKSRYENMLSTVIRGENKNVRLFLLANTISKYSPYFLMYGIEINKVDQGSIITKEIPTDSGEVLKVAFEYCEFNEEAAKNISKYSTNAMIKSGKWEIPETDDIPTVPGSVIKEQLLFTIYSEEVDVTVGCFVRKEKWAELLKDPETLLSYPKYHVREFLVLRTVERKSNYFHLSKQKSLKYTDYNDIGIMLQDIKDNCDIDFEDELYRGRVFCDNSFTGDYFCKSWVNFGRVAAEDLL